MAKEEKLSVAINNEGQLVTWRHPGGKLRRYGADKLTDEELLAVLIGQGIQNKSAEELSTEILKKYQSFRGLANQPLEELYKIKGLKEVKVSRIAAALEIARRIVRQIS